MTPRLTPRLPRSVRLTKSSTTFLIAILLAGALLTCWMAWPADHATRHDLLEHALTMLTQEAAALGPPQAEGICLSFGSTKINANYQIVDAVKDKHNAVATFFVKKDDAFIRVSTSVQQEGNRAVDTKLDPAGKPYAALSKGQSYEGDADILGSRYDTIYQPVSNDQKQVVGAFFVGVAKENVTARVAPTLGPALLALIISAAALIAPRRFDPSPKPAMRRLLPPLTLMLILLLLAAGTLLYQQDRQRRATETASQLADVNHDLATCIQQQALGLATALQPITADADVHRALRNGAPQSLLAAWEPVFLNLRRDAQVTHLYFLDAHRVCLLRVHQPNRRGDTINRFTTLQAERTGKIASGIELGPMGTFTLRVVKPVFDGPTLIGYVELGKELQDALGTLSTEPGDHLALLIAKQHLDRHAWEDGMRMLGRNPDWDRLPQSVLSYASQTRLPTAFIDIAERSMAANRDEPDHEVAFDGKDWRVSASPLTDASGTEVATFLIARDITAQKAAFGRLLILGGTAGAVLLTLLLSFVYVLLRRTDLGIRAQQAELHASKEQLSSTLRSIGDGVIACDTQGNVVSLNAVAEKLTAWNTDQARGRPIAEVFRIIHADSRQPAEIPVSRTLRDDCIVELANHTALLARDGTERQIADSCAPIHDAAGAVIGAVLVFRDVTAEYRQRQLLRASEEKHRDLLQHLPVGLYRNTPGPQGRFLMANPALAKMFGYPSVQHLLNVSVEDLYLNAADRQAFSQKLLQHGNLQAEELQLRKCDGTPIWASVTAQSVRDSNGQTVHFDGVVEDITQRKHAEEALRVEQENLKAIFASAPVGMLLLNEDMTIVAANSVLAAMLSRDLAQIIHQPCGAGLGCAHNAENTDGCGHGSACPTCPLRQSVDQVLHAGTSVRGVEIHPALLIDGQTKRPCLSISAEPVLLNARKHVLVAFDDITTRKTMEQELRTAARTDRLTGLPNRALFSDRLQQAILRAQRDHNYHFAVLFLDFDRFKTINDSLGHGIGDQLLQQISQRLCRTVRSGDSLSREARQHTAARLGGDEFVVLLDGLAKPDDATFAADRMLEAFAQPYQLGEHRVYSTASIGIVTNIMPSDSPEDILRDADTAMYEAKLAGKGQYMVFDVSMRQRVQHRLNLETDLRKALEAKQLFLMYQPIISLQTGHIESFEALIRWQHPQRGVIPPTEFIPIAEDTGLILPIGQWVLRQACSQFAHWRSTMGEAAPRSISVNLSRNQLVQPDLPGTIAQILRETGVTPACLHLEVTESAVMKDAAAHAKMLLAIKAIGVKLDMDDFGTGYSSLACLHEFPIDVLKIDRSFVTNIDRGRDVAALVHAVAQLARNLNITVVAEGIETPEQAMMLQALDCEFGQGYLFSKPMLPEQVPHFRLRPGVLPGQLENAVHK